MASEKTVVNKIFDSVVLYPGKFDSGEDSQIVVVWPSVIVALIG